MLATFAALSAIPGIKTALAWAGMAVVGVIAYFNIKTKAEQAGVSAQVAADQKQTVEAYKDAVGVQKEVAALAPGAADKQLRDRFSIPSAKNR